MRVVKCTGGTRARWAAVAAVLTAAAAVAGCSSSGGAASADGKIIAIGAENEYADVISQIGGKYVSATAIMSNPNTDPHTFEASASVSEAVQKASLVVQNGVGYDDFMTTIEKAAGNSHRTVIDVQTLRHLPDSTRNPHLWYDPKTMPVVAAALVKDLSALQPKHAAYFRAREATFLASLTPWTKALAAFEAAHPNLPVATTEPVADYMLQAAGTDDMTPWSLQAAIMNGTDPAPQDVATQASLFAQHRVKVFLYNQQVTDDITAKFLAEAHSAGIPVVGVYETMPTDGYNYQRWMLAEVHALSKAVTDHVSTEKL